MPEHPPMPPRAPSAVGFLQLSEDSSTSKSPRRGPALPSLMSTRSSASLLRAQRKSFSRAKDDGNLEAGKPERRSSLDDDGIPVPPSTFPIKGQKKDERKPSAANVLMTPQMRSQRLIGNSNPRYRWERYYKTGEELKVLRKPVYVEIVTLDMWCIMSDVYIDESTMNGITTLSSSTSTLIACSTLRCRRRCCRSMMWTFRARSLRKMGEQMITVHQSKMEATSLHHPTRLTG